MIIAFYRVCTCVCECARACVRVFPVMVICDRSSGQSDSRGDSLSFLHFYRESRFLQPWILSTVRRVKVSWLNWTVSVWSRRRTKSTPVVLSPRLWPPVGLSSWRSWRLHERSAVTVKEDLDLEVTWLNWWVAGFLTDSVLLLVLEEPPVCTVHKSSAGAPGRAGHCF